MASWRDVLPIHPAAELFPLMLHDELRALGEDIRAHGLRSPISLLKDADGKFSLLDGRNRLDGMEAVGQHLEFCLESNGGCGLKIDGAFGYLDWYQDEEGFDPFAFVTSANIHRRHLTAEQKRDLIAKLIKAQPDKSALQISKMAKSSPHTVIKVRDDLVAKGDVCKVQTSTDTKGRKQPAKKKRRTEDDFSRDLQTKKAAAVTTAMPGDIEPMLPDAVVAVNPIIAAWDNASDKQRQEFVKLRRDDIARVESPPVTSEAHDLDDIPPFLRRAAS